MHLKKRIDLKEERIYRKGRLMKICTIFTGGTIGSILDESGYIGPKEGTPYRLLDLYQKQCKVDVEFETLEPYRILSENLSSKHIEILIKTVQKVLTEKTIDGIIITHGTDTLQYGAALLGYVFGHVDIPIVLVSSNYVLDDKRANGLINFHYAVEFIKGQHGKGVFVSYCNTDAFPTIHRATRLQPLIPYSDYVASVQDSWYGRYENGHYIANPEYYIKEGQASFNCSAKDLQLNDCSKEITFIHPYVGMNYPKLTNDTKAVLHGSYHSGTVCVEGPLKDFMSEAKSKNIPVFLTGLLAGEHAYETVREYEALGIKVLHTASEVAQYCKLWLALSNHMDVEKIMNMSVAEDWI